MSRLPLQRRTLALLAVVVPLLALFIYVVLRSGPLAPVAVTVATARQRAITPALFGIGTVEARTTYHVGPTVAGRVLRLSVEVGERVAAGQVLGEMDAVDFDERLRAQAAAVQRAGPPAAGTDPGHALQPVAGRARHQRRDRHRPPARLG